MLREKVILIGGGGHANSVIDSIISENKYEIYGIIDNNLEVGFDINGVKVLGCDDKLENIYRIGVEKAFISIGSIGNTRIRENLARKLEKIGFKFINVIDKTAIISDNVDLGEGIFIGKGVIINTGCIIMNHAIINTGVIIDHDCIISEFVHLSPRTTLAGNVFIGKTTHIGIASTVIQGIKIGENSIIGAGSIILSNIKDNSRKFGIVHEK